MIYTIIAIILIAASAYGFGLRFGGARYGATQYGGAKYGAVTIGESVTFGGDSVTFGGDGVIW